MTKKFLAVCVVGALAGVTWFILEDDSRRDDARPDTGSRPRTEAPQHAGTLAEVGPAQSEQRGPIGTARFRETGSRTRDGRESSAAPRATLTGRVVDEAQRAVPDAGVVLRLSRQDLDAGPEDRRQELGSLDVRTDANGRFTFTHVPVGYEGRIRARPDKLCDVTRDLEVDAARTFDVGDLIANTGGSIAGQVTAPSDVDVTSATVTAWHRMNTRSGRPGLMAIVRPEAAERRSVRPRADGSYRIDGLDQGEWILGVEIAGFPRKLPRDAQVTKGDVTWDVDLAVVDAGYIAGQVLDQEGAVLVNARVSFRVDDRSLKSLLDRRETATATTGKNGRFALRGLDATAGRLRVAKGGFRSWVEPSVAPDGEELIIRLAPTGIVFGIVSAKAGDAPDSIEVMPTIADSLGTGARRNMRVVYGEEAASAAGVLDAPGLFAVLDTPADPIRLRFRAPGFAEAVVSPIVVSSGARQRHDVSLVREVVVAGVVIDPNGNPVALARVSVTRPSPDAAAESPGFNRRRVERRVVMRTTGAPEDAIGTFVDGNVAVTDAEGRFEVKGLGSGTWNLRASHGDHADSEAETVDLAAGAPGDIKLTLRRSGALAGTVLARDGAPKAGARVMVSASESTSGGLPSIPVNVISDNDGRFQRKGLAPGRYEARLFTSSDEGQVMVLRTNTAADDPSTVRFEIKEGQTTTITINEPEFGVVTGVVRANGAPVAAARVGLQADGTPQVMGGPSVPCDARGGFRFEDVVPGRYVISVHPPGAARPITRTVTVAAEPPVHEIIDLPSGGIEGRVLDQDGKPVAGLTIGVVPTREDAGPRRRRGIMVMITDDGDGPTTTVRTVGGADGSQPVRTDGDGRYVVRFLSPDIYNVSVSGGGWISQKVEHVDVKEALVTKRVDMQTSKGATLVVTVNGPDGNAPQVVVGRIARPGEENAPLKTEAGAGDQPLRFEGLATGRYIVTVFVPGGAPPGGGLKGSAEVEVQAGVETPLEVQLKRDP